MRRIVAVALLVAAAGALLFKDQLWPDTGPHRGG